MNDKSFDVSYIGFLLASSKMLSNLKICVIEAQDQNSKMADESTPFSNRVTSITPTSIKFLKGDLFNFIRFYNHHPSYTDSMK